LQNTVACMPLDHPFHVRRKLRLRGRDYSAPGAYFLTLCTDDRRPILAEDVHGTVALNDFGRVVAASWKWLPSQYPHGTLDEWCVMPDHLHGILVVATDGARASTPGDAARPPKSLGGLIGAFKTVSTKQINRIRDTPGAIVWQRGFWDHVIRDAADLQRIREYIRVQGTRPPSL
jgi:REP-associated tyrosine transposase